MALSTDVWCTVGAAFAANFVKRMCLHNLLAVPANEQAFTNYVRQKFGYGHWSAPYWFIGPEERGGDSCLDITTRVIQWAGTSPEDAFDLKDLRHYCERIGVHQFHDFHNAAPAAQRTWSALLRLLGTPATLGNDPPEWFPAPIPNDPLGAPHLWRRRFQRDYLARQAGGGIVDHEVALLEISPLPNPSEKAWVWAELADTPINNAAMFASRPAFLAHDQNPNFVAGRLQVIVQQLHQQRPRLVVFYGSINDHLADPISGCFPGFDGAPNQEERVRHHTMVHEDNQVTHLLWIFHPSYWRRIGGNAYLDQVFQLMQA